MIEWIGQIQTTNFLDFLHSDSEGLLVCTCQIMLMKPMANFHFGTENET